MSTWQQRVAAEQAELDAKVSDLIKFMATTEYLGIDVVMRGLLVAQLNAMKTYSTLLQARLDISDNIDDTPAPSRATG